MGGEDTDLAIKQELEAVTFTPLESAKRAEFLNIAIEKMEEAVATVPLDSAERPVSLNNLGYSYLHGLTSNQELTDLEEAISNFRLSSLSLRGLPT